MMGQSSPPSSDRFSEALDILNAIKYAVDAVKAEGVQDRIAKLADAKAAHDESAAASARVFADLVQQQEEIERLTKAAVQAEAVANQTIAQAEERDRASAEREKELKLRAQAAADRDAYLTSREQTVARRENDVSSRESAAEKKERELEAAREDLQRRIDAVKAAAVI